MHFNIARCVFSSLGLGGGLHCPSALVARSLIENYITVKHRMTLILCMCTRDIAC